MKKLFIILLISLLVGSLQARTFFSSLDGAGEREFRDFFSHHLKELYHFSEEKRDTKLKDFQQRLQQSHKAGDRLFLIQILSRFIQGKERPKQTLLSEDDWEEIHEQQENSLELLVDLALEEKLSLSLREGITDELSRIAQSDFLFNFDWNEDALKGLIKISEEKNLVIQHAALMGFKPIILKADRKWEDLAEDAADALVEELASENLELQRIVYLESLNVLKDATIKNDATEIVWEEVAKRLDSIQSPRFQMEVRFSLNEIMNLKSGTLFKEEKERAKEKLSELKSLKKSINQSFKKLLTSVAEVDNPGTLEAILDRLKSTVSTDPTRFHSAYTLILKNSLHLENSDYKLRMLDEALIDLTHQSKSAPFFYRTALFLMGQISIFKDHTKSKIVVVMLSNLLSSTDHTTLILPLLEEIYSSTQSTLPAWLERRLISLLFIQAGDSQIDQTAMKATAYLIAIAKASDSHWLRWEALQRLKLLSRLASNPGAKSMASSL